MDTLDSYAIITARHEAIGEIDILASREIPVREIIRNLFDALSCEKKDLRGYYAKAERAQVLLAPGDTLKSKGVYDGDILRIL